MNGTRGEARHKRVRWTSVAVCSGGYQWGGSGQWARRRRGTTQRIYVKGGSERGKERGKDRLGAAIGEQWSNRCDTHGAKQE